MKIPVSDTVVKSLGSQPEAIQVDNRVMLEMDGLLLDERGRMKLLPAVAYSIFPHQELRAWASIRARYGFPTVELVQWLKKMIHGRTALEIGAGMGDLGRHLGISMTDSYQQVTDFSTTLYITSLGLAPTTPPKDVIKMDAQTAVLLNKPKVVIGSWITQRWLPGDDHGNPHGPREEVIVKNCDCYIVIGNEPIHCGKRIMSMPHQTYHFPWLVSRASNPDKNVIYVWGK